MHALASRMKNPAACSIKPSIHTSGWKCVYGKDDAISPSCHALTLGLLWLAGGQSTVTKKRRHITPTLDLRTCVPLEEAFRLLDFMAGVGETLLWSDTERE